MAASCLELVGLFDVVDLSGFTPAAVFTAYNFEKIASIGFLLVLELPEELKVTVLVGLHIHDFTQNRQRRYLIHLIIQMTPLY